ncbi:unnamed protein product, partial [Mesorhabditis belari]|uniref:RNA-binding protein 42 n=1 Tax=Mesorhabditis belari TaxID=2138241 RepID=A0AAF3F4Z1_9BILA
MTSIDDELALFEQEINSLGTTAPTSSTTSQIVAAPTSNVKVPTSSNGAHIVSAAPSIFMPPQLRNTAPAVSRPTTTATVPTPSRAPPYQQDAVIESGPSLYRAPELAYTQTVSEAPKLAPLPSDVEAMSRKRDIARREAMMSKAVGKKFVRQAGGQTWEDPSLADWDQNDFRIFCGDLGNEVSDELLAKAFRKYPSFLKAKVIRDGRSNKSKGFGFVSFKSQEDYVRAMREMDGKYVGNRPIKLRKSNWQDRQIEVVKKKTKQKQKLGLIY